MVVLNDAGTVAGAVGTVSGTLRSELLSPAATATDSVTVAEPVVSVTVSPVSVPGSLDAGDDVAFTLVVRAHDGANANPAYLAVLRDATLVTSPSLYSVRSVTVDGAELFTAGGAGASWAANHSSTGSIFAAASLAELSSGGTSIVYTVRLGVAVEADSIVRPEFGVVWSSHPGPADAPTAVSRPYSAAPATQPSITIASPTLSVSLETDSATSSDSEAVIGSRVTAFAAITVPEGTTSLAEVELALSDTSPGSVLRILEVVSITESSGGSSLSSSGGAFSALAAAATSSITGSGLGGVVVSLGNLTNSASSPSTAEVLTVEVRMVVLNDAGTVAGAVGTVSGTLRSELLSPAATATDSVTVAEPVVSVTVSPVSVPGSLDAGDDVAFTLVVRAHDGANANPAYLAVLRDATLVTSPSLYSVRSVTVDGAELFTAGGAGASWAANHSSTGSIFAAASLAELSSGGTSIVYTVRLGVAVEADSIVRPEFGVVWSSHPGPADAPTAVSRPYSAAPATQPSITIASPTLSVSLETDSATSSDSEAVIGSRVTAFAAITVPEGTTSLAEVELALSDTSPGSVLRILEVVSITESSGGSSLSSSGGAFSALAAAATSGITGSGLGGVVVSLGNLTNSASSPSTAEVLTVEVRMVVLNDAGTVAGAVGTVSGTLRSELLSPAATATDSVTVAEPVVSVTVSPVSVPGFLDAGDDVAFTLVVRAHDGANANPAYLAVLRDATLVTSPSLYSVRSLSSGGTSIVYTVRLGVAVEADSIVRPEFGVVWSSHPGPADAPTAVSRPYSAAPATQPSITIASPTLSVSLETDSATSSDSEAVIGSRVTAFAAITVPEGTTSLAEVELALSDTSPGSVLRILEVVSITESSGGSSLSSSGGAFSALAAAATSGITGSGLGGVVVSLGNLTNSASSPSTAEVLTVEVRMVVLNDAGTVAGAVGTVSGTLRSELLSPAATATDSVTVAEPVVSVTVSPVSVPGSWTLVTTWRSPWCLAELSSGGTSIVYTVRLGVAVEADSIVRPEFGVVWSSHPGPADAPTAVSRPYSAAPATQPSITIASPTLSVSLETDSATSSDSEAVIGSRVTAFAAITVPEGTTSLAEVELALSDTSPGSVLRILEVVSITESSGGSSLSSSGGAFSALAAAATSGITGSGLGGVVVSLGNLTNSASSPSTAEVLTVEVRMVVLNDAGTVAGAVGTVSGTLRSELLSPAATATDSVTVAEPVVSVTVSPVSVPGSLDAGDDVAFTLVVRAHDGANANPAYLAVLRDATLVTSPSLYSVRSVTVDGAELFTAGGAGASWAANHSSTGSIFAAASLAELSSGGTSIVYTVRLGVAVEADSIVRPEFGVVWSSHPGPADAPTAVSRPYSAAPATQPSITIASPTLSVSLETDSATSSDSEAVIGSRVTAFAAITVPEGTTSLAEVELALSDTSPGSVLRILEVVSITESSGGSSLSSSGGAFSALAAAATSGITGSGLGGVVVSLGNLTNSASSPSTAEVLTVEVRMVVLNDAGTVAGAVGTVSGTLRSELLSPAATATDSVTVAEPVVSVTVSPVSVPGFLDAGDDVAFTLVVRAHDGANANPAYLAVLRDATLVTSPSLYSVRSVTVDGAELFTAGGAGASWAANHSSTGSIFAAASLAELSSGGTSIVYTVRLGVAVEADSIVRPEFGVVWSSHPGPADAPTAVSRPYSAAPATQPSITIASPTLSVSLETDSATSSDSEAAIGSRVTAFAAITVPEGTTSLAEVELALSDTSPGSVLRILEVVSITESSGGSSLSSSGGAFSALAAAATSSITGSGLGGVVVSLGNLTNSASSPSTAEVLTVEVRMVVLNDAGTVAGAVGTVSGTLRSELLSPAATATDSVTVAEPVAAVEVRDFVSRLEGNLFQFAVRVCMADSSLRSDAFNVTLSDANSGALYDLTSLLVQLLNSPHLVDVSNSSDILGLRIAEVVPPSAALSTSGPVDAGDLVTTTVVVGHSGASNATAFGLTVRDAGLVAGGIVSGSARYSLLSVAVNGTAVPGASVGTSSWGFGDAVVELPPLPAGSVSVVEYVVEMLGSVEAGETLHPNVSVTWRSHPTEVSRAQNTTVASDSVVALTIRSPVVSVGVQTDDASPGNTTALRGQVDLSIVSVSSSSGAVTTSCAGSGGSLGWLASSGRSVVRARSVSVDMCDVTNTNTNDLVGEWVEVVIRGRVRLGVSRGAVVSPSASVSWLADGVDRVANATGSSASVEVLVAEVVPPSATLSTSGPVDAGDLVTTTVVVGHSGASNATAFGLTVRDAGLVAGGIVSGSARYSLLSVAVNGTAVPGASVGTSSWGFGDAVVELPPLPAGSVSVVEYVVEMLGSVEAGRRCTPTCR
ncbi:hypothetical protein FNF31_05716 [Cafeteria roenbergensis]|uniref:Uncharacterized protein n=1 Tax=Cafeteria roenbergensis TaxID=33653 RepID=A0A5A8CYE1_CAFRO|nr:hypothetical protein FNF31_05716 [Cafeteria roenbergensis]